MSILNTIVRLALRFRGVVVALACLLLAYGIFVLGGATYDVFPEFAPPQVAISTEVPGLSPVQVEMLVTQPIENAINGAPGVESMRSNSIQGISLITITFDPSADIYRDRQLITERLSTVTGELPQGVATPVITPLLSSTGDLFVIGLTSAQKSLMDLRTLADWTLKPHLLGVPGVAAVAIYGGDLRTMQIQLQPDRLVHYHLSVDEVLAAAQKATGIEGAGFIDTPNQRIILQTEGQVLQPALLARTVLRWQNGEAVRLGDVARVVLAPAPPIGAAHVNGQPGVLVKVSVQYGANTLQVSRQIERMIEGLKEPFAAQGVELHPDIFRAANFIETATHNVRTSLVIGAVLVAIVLFLFLFNLRTAAISCTAIPLSLITAVVVLQKLGYSLNTMTMGGLAIAIGEVVDDAVIGVENTLRRLVENRRSGSKRSVFQVVLAASIEVRSPVIYATCAVMLVFVPIMTMSGLAGRMFAPLGMAYILAILSSLVVALTLTPALCLILLQPSSLRESPSPLAQFLHPRYERLLGWVEDRGAWVIGIVAILTACGLCVFPFLSSSFLPTLRESHFIVHTTMAPGTSIEASLRHNELLAKALGKLPEVRIVSAQVGRAALDDVRGPEEAETDVDLKPGSDTQAADADIRKVLSQFPGAAYAMNSFLTERVNETLSGYLAPVAINIYGNDLAQLDDLAEKVSKLLPKISGASEIKLESPPGTPQRVIRLKPQEMLRRGFTPIEVMDAVRVSYEGAFAGQIHDGSETYAVSVILDPAFRNSAASIAKLPIRNSAGQYVMLGELADIYDSSGRSIVQHQAARRVQTVVCNVAGRAIGDFVAEAQKRIHDEIPLPSGVVVEFAGSAAAQATARADLLVHSAMAGVGILLLLSIALGHRNNLLLVLINLPFALVGGALATLLTGGQISLGSMVGFVTVFGITLRNSLLLLSHYEHLVAVEGQSWGLATAIRGARERLVPIMMTALVTSLGLLPLALGRNAPGREIEGPMAIVILGGLATSTMLNLIVLPTLALRFGRFNPPQDEEPTTASVTG